MATEARGAQAGVGGQECAGWTPPPASVLQVEEPVEDFELQTDCVLCILSARGGVGDGGEGLALQQPKVGLGLVGRAEGAGYPEAQGSLGRLQVYLGGRLIPGWATHDCPRSDEG